jgi:hypothetical protein
MFVDKVSIQVMEALIMINLPELLSPASVAQIENTLINKIAKESRENGEIHEYLVRKIQIFQNGIEPCKRHCGRPVTSKLWQTSKSNKDF